MKRPTTRLNQHEKEIVEAFDRDELVLHAPTPSLLARFAEAAENTSRKDRRINIRLSDHDLAGIQRKAAEQGIPYQSLISGLITSFSRGKSPSARIDSPGPTPSSSSHRVGFPAERQLRNSNL